MNQLRLPLLRLRRSEAPRDGKDRPLRDYLEIAVLAVVLALFLRAYVAQAFKIPSGSMKPTLRVGDHILVLKSIYGIRLPFTELVLLPVSDPARGDVVVFTSPVDGGKDFIKRVAAVSGDRVEIKSKRLYINGRPAPDPHARYADPAVYPVMTKPRDEFGPVVVPEGRLFVLGDNRDESYDSRFWGFVDLKDVRGRAFLIYWSWDSGKGSVRWNRIGRHVD